MPCLSLWPSQLETRPFCCLNNSRIKGLTMPRRDIFSKEKRSSIMSAIHSKNTKLDLTMKNMLLDAGLDFEMYPAIEGKPDFRVSKSLLLFCDSSFWHGRNWNELRAQLTSGSNSSYWVSHISKNRERDKKVNSLLRKRGFIVTRLWDNDIYSHPDRCLEIIRAHISTSQS